MKTILTHSTAETQDLASKLLHTLNEKNVIALYGDLGGGKTTFSQGVAKELGINRRIISPTFTIIKNYSLETSRKDFIFQRLYHVDLYRIGDPEEVIDLGILDFMKDPQSIILIEWAEKMEEYLPKRRIDVRFEYIDESKRRITIQYC